MPGELLRNIKSFLANFAGKSVLARVFGRVILQECFRCEPFSTMPTSMHHTIMRHHMVLVIRFLTETFLTLITIPLEVSCVYNRMSQKIAFRREAFAAMLTLKCAKLSVLASVNLSR